MVTITNRYNFLTIIVTWFSVEYSKGINNFQFTELIIFDNITRCAYSLDCLYCMNASALRN